MYERPNRAFILILVLCATCARAQSSGPKSTSSDTPFSVGIGFKASSLGLGGELAVPVMWRANIRAGFNLFSYSHTFSSDGVPYSGTLDLRSAQAQFDFFPFAGAFHLSPGVMFYNGNNINARTTIAPGQTVDIGGTTWRSSPADPLNGTGKLSLSKVGPMFTLGWGNLVPRGDRHLSFSFEGGFVYQGEPSTRLNFSGSACTTAGVCRSVQSNPAFQADVVREQNRLNDNASPFRFYPIISTGVGYRF